MTRQKGFSAIEVLVAIAFLTILAGGVWMWRGQTNQRVNPQPTIFFEPTSPLANPTISQDIPTAAPSKKIDIALDWKTYVSPDNTYSFKYPDSSDWVFQENEAPLGKSPSVECKKCLSGENVDLFLVVPIIYKSLDEYLDSHPVSDGYITDYKKIQLDNKEVIQAVQPGGPQAGGSFIKIIFTINDQGYEVSIRFRGLENKEKLEQFPDPNPDILSTFKFLD